MHIVVIADSGRARIFTVGASLTGFEEQQALVHSESRLKMRDRVSDSQARLSQGNVAEPHTAPRDVEHARFAKEVATHVAGLDFERLIIAAPPKLLGALRKAIHVPQGTLVADIPKDLTRLPTPEIERIVRTSLPPTFGMP